MKFAEVLGHAEEKRKELKQEMRAGNVEAFPYEMGQQTGCDYCEYRNICGFDEAIPGYEYRKLGKLSKEEALQKIHEDAERRKSEWQ